MTVALYDVLGYPVVKLTFAVGAPGGMAGDNAVLWSGRDSAGGIVESGVYWLVVTPRGEKARKIRLTIKR